MKEGEMGDGVYVILYVVFFPLELLQHEGIKFSVVSRDINMRLTFLKEYYNFFSFE